MPSPDAPAPDAPPSPESPRAEKPSLRTHLDGLMDQYDAITEADRRWGSSRRRGIALVADGQHQVGIQDDFRGERSIHGRGTTYEAAFRDALAKGFVADGDYAGNPSRNPLYRDL